MAAKNFKVFTKGVSASAEGTYQLSTEQVQSFRDNGYLVIKKLIDLPALDSYRQRFVDICQGRLEKNLVTIVKEPTLYNIGANPEDFINKIQELLHDEVFSTYSEDPRLLNVVAQLIGEDITGLNCMLINKPPGTGEHVVHQDMPYFPVHPAHKVLTTWTAIDPARRDNGCLYVIPGSHKAGEVYPLLEYINDGKPFTFGVADGDTLAPVHKRVYLEMEPGDTVFFSPLLVHGSNANHSKGDENRQCRNVSCLSCLYCCEDHFNEYRKAMTCNYANSNCRYTEVKGTIHEPIATPVEEFFRKRGSNLSYLDFFRMKTKTVRGVRCNL